MKLALDASVLLTVFYQEPGAEDWMEVLIQARRAARERGSRARHSAGDRTSLLAGGRRTPASGQTSSLPRAPRSGATWRSALPTTGPPFPPNSL